RKSPQNNDAAGKEKQILFFLLSIGWRTPEKFPGDLSCLTPHHLTEDESSTLLADRVPGCCVYLGLLHSPAQRCRRPPLHAQPACAEHGVGGAVSLLLQDLYERSHHHGSEHRQPGASGSLQPT
ncbi:hypothetical protein OTU49_017394, partial [Cherax quadricarinatus]